MSSLLFHNGHRIWTWVLGLMLTSLTISQANAIDFQFQPVGKPGATQVYAYIGPLNNRTPDNLGLNNNIGLIVTDQGAVLVDSGAGIPSAKALELAIKNITDHPIIAVINTGSQDHRWLGNGYFKNKGAKLYALQSTVHTQQEMGLGLVEKMTKVSDIFADTQPVSAEQPFDSEHAKFNIGGMDFELIFFGDAHFPGDAVLWLPKQQILFSGDMIYVDRMLGVHPFTPVASWQQAFYKAETLPAKYIVPGHGQISDWHRARQDTGNYLDKLVKTMSEANDEMIGVSQAVKDNQDWEEFKHLENYDAWHKRILNRTYLQFEEGM